MHSLPPAKLVTLHAPQKCAAKELSCDGEAALAAMRCPVVIVSRMSITCFTCPHWCFCKIFFSCRISQALPQALGLFDASCVCSSTDTFSVPVSFGQLLVVFLVVGRRALCFCFSADCVRQLAATQVFGNSSLIAGYEHELFSCIVQPL